MEPFATLEDLNAYLGRAVDPARAELFLDLASGAIRDYLRQSVNRVEGDEVRLRPTGGKRLLLPELPVWSVDDVTETVNGTETALTSGADYRLDEGPDGRYAVLVRLKGQSWPSADPDAGEAFVTVTYDHGYDVPGESSGAEHPIPDVFRTRAVLVAARGLSNPTGLRQETIGRYSYTTAGASDTVGLYLTTGDQDALARYHPGTMAGARA